MSLNKILLILHLEPLFHKIFLYLSFGSLSEIFLIKISHANPDNEENIEAGASYTCMKTNHAAKETARETLSWSAHSSFKFLYVDEVIKQLHSYRKKNFFWFVLSRAWYKEKAVRPQHESNLDLKYFKYFQSISWLTV